MITSLTPTSYFHVATQVFPRPTQPTKYTIHSETIQEAPEVRSRLTGKIAPAAVPRKVALPHFGSPTDRASNISRM